MSNELDFFKMYNLFMQDAVLSEIMLTNKVSQKYGLVLTKKDAEELLNTRKESLKGLGRVEVGGGTIEKIIKAFCNSSYIWQKNYANTLHELLETFYYIKNETLDMVGDDELIDIMKNFFENSCRGSIELLQGRELENFARNIRFGTRDAEESDVEEEDI